MPKDLGIYLSSINNCIVDTSANVHQVHGLKDTNVLLSSEHRYFISNNTNSNVYCTIEIGLTTHDFKSTTQEVTHTLKPKEVKVASANLRLAYFYSKPGIYKVYAYTNISGGCTSTALDTGFVNIK